jgi:hypothetical protein
VSRAIERRLIAAERRLNPPVPAVEEIFIIREIIIPGGLPGSDDDPTFATAGELWWERAPAETWRHSASERWRQQRQPVSAASSSVGCPTMMSLDRRRDGDGGPLPSRSVFTLLIPRIRPTGGRWCVQTGGGRPWTAAATLARSFAVKAACPPGRWGWLWQPVAAAWARRRGQHGGAAA